MAWVPRRKRRIVVAMAAGAATLTAQEEHDDEDVTRTCLCSAGAGFRAAVRASLVAGQPCATGHGEGHGDGLHVGQPAPDDQLEVRTNDGKMEKWLVGGPAVTRMEANGWTRTTVKPGDVITGIGYQFSDGQKIIRLERVVLADGKEMLLYGR